MKRKYTKYAYTEEGNKISTTDYLKPTVKPRSKFANEDFEKLVSMLYVTGLENILKTDKSKVINIDTENPTYLKMINNIVSIPESYKDNVLKNSFSTMNLYNIVEKMGVINTKSNEMNTNNVFNSFAMECISDFQKAFAINGYMERSILEKQINVIKSHYQNVNGNLIANYRYDSRDNQTRDSFMKEDILKELVYRLNATPHVAFDYQLNINDVERLTELYSFKSIDNDAEKLEIYCDYLLKRYNTQNEIFDIVKDNIDLLNNGVKTLSAMQGRNVSFNEFLNAQTLLGTQRLNYFKEGFNKDVTNKLNEYDIQYNGEFNENVAHVILELNKELKENTINNETINKIKL